MGCFGGGIPHQNTPNTLFAGLRMSLRAYAIAMVFHDTAPFKSSKGLSRFLPKL